MKLADTCLRSNEQMYLLSCGVNFCQYFIARFLLTDMTAHRVVCSVKALVDMEAEFARCIQFLSSMIKKVTLRGTFPHCKFHF